MWWRKESSEIVLVKSECIRFIFTQFPVILYVALLVLMHFYDLDEQLPKIKQELEQRAAGTAEV